MRNIINILVGLMIATLIPVISFSQDSSQIKWSYKVNKININQYEINFTGSIAKGWHIYDADLREGLTGLLVTSLSSKLSVNIDKSRIKLIQDPVFENSKKSVFENQVLVNVKAKVFDQNESALKLKISCELGNADNFIPDEQQLNVVLNENKAKISENRILISSIDLKNALNQCGIAPSSKNESQSKSLLNIFLIGFLGGLVALLTPCVFPMIPLTVSFFTKKATSKKSGITNAFLYGFFIFFIYILLSLPFHFLDSINPEFLNNISTNVYLNIVFFAVFVFFAFSFFGYYEISLPSSFSSGADNKAGSGNIVGIFFMALTLALVSFSCTGPILGSLLAGSLASDGGAMQLTAGMGGFGLALALPFALFALFPNWLQSLPKSGGWLNTVKVTLGFLELAMALKFLSNADLVKHWGILKREIFIAIWIAIGLLLSLYLFGRIRFSHDSSNDKLSIGRKFLAIMFALFTLYLLPGVTNTQWANLKLISGFPPPLYYSVYQKSSDCVLGLNCTRDYEQGLKRARAEHKPILIDFTGYACVNCRRMEENVWSDPQVYKVLHEKFIVVSLYVDDKKSLPANKQFIYKTKDGSDKEINTIGDQWATFETENFANNAQPFYALLSPDEQLLNNPVGYTPDKNDYLQWLNCGLDTYQSIKQ